jgi:hypothetical protein
MTQPAQENLARDHTSAKTLPYDEREQARRFFAENGYFVLRDVVSKERLSALSSRISEEFETTKTSGALFSGGGLMSGHLNCFPGEASRFAYEELEGYGIIDLVREMFGQLGPMNVGCNWNLPKSVVQHYHVDSSFKDEFPIVNIAVVDTDLVNGAIEVSPKTHKRFYKYWRFAVERPYRFAVRLPLNRGDVLVRTSNLWHRGMPNNSAVPRPMLAFTFGDKRDGPRPADPFQVNEGKITFYPNWFRPSFLGRLRERTFLAAPITYASYRFVRSLFGSKGFDPT